jgi:hypothetical protein
VVLLELGHPSYDRADRTVTFRVRRLRTTRRVQLASIARRADPGVARRFGRASLFIDDGPSLALDFSAQALAVTLPSGQQVLGTVAIDLPATGRVVEGDVVLPFGDTVTLSSEAGSVTTAASGPISIPAPAPPR